MSLYDEIAAAFGGTPASPPTEDDVPTITPRVTRADRLRALADHPDTPSHEAEAARRALDRLENP